LFYGCGHCYIGIDYRDSQVKEDEGNKEKDLSNIEINDISKSMDNEQLNKLDELEKFIGKNKKVNVNVGELIPTYSESKDYTKVIAIEKDILNNEIYFTEYNFINHIKQDIKKSIPNYQEITKEICN